MDFFKGKTVVVTGASSGIGRALAEYFAAAGANAVLGARHEDALREIVGRIGAAGGHAAYAVCDVTREADCKRLIDTAVDTFGGVDVLICNAGISMRALFDHDARKCHGTQARYQSTIDKDLRSGASLLRKWTQYINRYLPARCRG